MHNDLYMYRIGGKFSNGANFRIFRMHLPHAKIYITHGLRAIIRNFSV